MGSNKRYPDLGERRRREREIAQTLASGPLHSLSDEQLDLGGSHLTIAAPASRLVTRAWVRFGTVDIQVDARVLRWTDSAVGITFTLEQTAYRCWVWRGACTIPDEA